MIDLNVVDMCRGADAIEVAHYRNYTSGETVKKHRATLGLSRSLKGWKSTMRANCSSIAKLMPALAFSRQIALVKVNAVQLRKDIPPPGS